MKIQDNQGWEKKLEELLAAGETVLVVPAAQALLQLECGLSKFPDIMRPDNPIFLYTRP